MDLMEQHGDDRTHQAGNDHRHDEGNTDAAGEQERLPPRIGFEEVDIAAEEAQRHDGQKRTVDQTHPHLLPEQMQLFGGGQVLVHQHADGDGQRLGADIARHIQHHGLEADDDGQDSHHRLKGTHHRGHQHPEKEQSDQPGQALLDTLEDALVQIFFAGQAAQLCVIVAHLVIDQFDDIRRGDDAHQLAGIVQDRQRALGVVYDAVDAVANLFVVGHIGVGPGNELFEAVLRTGDDEVFQVDGAVELVVLVHDVEGRDVVVLARLLHQLTHGLPDGHVLPDADVVGGHAAADLVLAVGEQHLHIFGGVFVQLADDLGFILFLEVVQSVHGVVRVHVGNDVGGLLAGQFFQVRFCVVQIGEDLGHGIHAQNGIELLALVGRQGCEGVGKVVLVVIRELFGQLCLRQAAVDEGEYFLLVVLLLHLGFLLPFWGIKIHRVVFWSDSCGVSWADAFRTRQIQSILPASQEERCLGLSKWSPDIVFASSCKVFAFFGPVIILRLDDFFNPFYKIFTRLLPDRTKEQPLSREESGCSQLFCKSFA